MLASGLLLALLAAPTTPAEFGPVPKGSVRVFLVRHGQALSNLDPTPDLPPEKLDALTALGTTQAKTTANALRRTGIAAVFSSPAGRARETAAILGAELGTADVLVEPRLHPLELGRREDGQPLDWDERIADWEAGRDPAPPGGESLSGVGQRVAQWCRSLAASQAGRSVAAVAHSEVIGSFLAVVDQVSPARAWPPKVPNGSVTVIEADAVGAITVLLRAWVPAAAPPP
jgi:broad specificity phosphatase PhoE